MSFWYKEQKAANAGIKKHCPISAKIISEKKSIIVQQMTNGIETIYPLKPF